MKSNGDGSKDISKAKRDKKTIEPTFTISVYGGKEDEIRKSLDRNLSAEGHVYQTWVNVRALKSLGFLFEGGVESAGGLVELLGMFAVIIILFALFAFWHVVVFFIVIGVLTLLSGGVALKYVRGSFIEGDESRIVVEELASFVREQVQAGNFVETKTTSRQLHNEMINRSNRDTKLFKSGIHLALIAATVFFVIEVIYRVLFAEWLTALEVLIGFGVLFLVGVIIMNMGVFLRRRFDSELSAG